MEYDLLQDGNHQTTVEMNHGPGQDHRNGNPSQTLSLAARIVGGETRKEVEEVGGSGDSVPGPRARCSVAAAAVSPPPARRLRRPVAPASLPPLAVLSQPP
jgi:hypothetical protein